MTTLLTGVDGQTYNCKFVPDRFQNHLMSHALETNTSLHVACGHITICHLQSANQATCANQRTSQGQDLRVPHRRFWRTAANKKRAQCTALRHSSVYRKIMANGIFSMNSSSLPQYKLKKGNTKGKYPTGGTKARSNKDKITVRKLKQQRAAQPQTER